MCHNNPVLPKYYWWFIRLFHKSERFKKRGPNFSFAVCGSNGIPHKANKDSIQTLFKAFDEFSKALGMQANLSKSQAFFGGISKP
ncbi:hypothetical protein L6164_001150 [Bauhinia variegata]|uniref:Uncharacterized protein n=1 Tax=Bauhinia variegata TaxID=167791 RepID=A0ACB9QAT0_BAUVA|nr:hypothetical protein L6164_001150 [Bauhinia variegata]